MTEESETPKDLLEKGRHESWEKVIDVTEGGQVHRPWEMEGYALSDYTSGIGCAFESDKIQVLFNKKEAGTGAVPHEHPNEQFNYVVEGTLRVIIEGEEEIAPTGSLSYIPANATHQTIATPEADVKYLEIKDPSYGISGYEVEANEGAHHDPNQEPQE